MVGMESQPTAPRTSWSRCIQVSSRAELREASQMGINPRGDERERLEHEESTRPHRSEDTFRERGR
jgi:hypothetical protein